MNNKNFLTTNQQMKHLRNEKLIACEGSMHKRILLQHGYFNLVNGYKDPFVTRKDNDKHIYMRGTTVEHLAAVYDFDRKLRNILTPYLTKVEDEVRTLFGYKLDKFNNPDNTGISWFSLEAYGSGIDAATRMDVVSKAYNEVVRSRADYVKFYLDNHKRIPTWIMIKVIRFKTFIDMLDISDTSIQDELCKLYQVKDITGQLSRKTMISSLETIRLFRNACVHNERIYSISIINKGLCSYHLNMPRVYREKEDRRLINVLLYLKYYLEKDEYFELICQLECIYNELEVSIPIHAFNRVRAQTGIRNMEHLDNLKKNQKNINYNSFS